MEPKKTPVSKEAAQASLVFDQLCAASTLKSILGHHRHLCELLRLKPSPFPHFYPKLKSKLCSWKAKALWTKFDKRASHKCYNRGKACSNTKVLIIGGGPCGLRTAIEAQLLGAKVVVVEKRDRISRHNVLHLWPFVIHDLKALNAKKFFGKFCAGAIDHISIRQLQCILLKVALILGVEFHEGVGFEALVPPAEDQSVEKNGWRAKVTPADHPVSQYEFDVLIGADGKRNTLEGFKRKEFRGKLAIAITANFINRHSEAEARVEEISGVAFIFNQKFFKDLYEATGIDLENIVYYKDETHYFVMTAKKHSLINNGVILQDYPDTIKLLSSDNKDKDALMKYARDAAEFSTSYMMPNLEFAVDHYGQPDVAMFDFTSMFAAENASRVVERHGYRLLQMLVGDSLLEPFWPTGSGCARGFLSSMDACWAIKSWGTGQVNPLEVLAERESIYRILAQTTPENLQRDYAAYTLDPHTRYPNLNKQSVSPIQVKGLFDTDDPSGIELPQIMQDLPKKRRRKDSQVHPDTLLHWLKKQVALYDSVHIENMTSSFKDGLVLCAIIHRYRPDLLDFHALTSDDVAKNNQLAFDTLERELGIPPVMTGLEMEQCDIPDKLTMLSYLSQIYDTFRGEIPHIKHPKLEPEVLEEKPVPSIHAQLRNLKPEHKVSLMARLTGHPPRVTPSRKRISSDRESAEGGGARAGSGEKRADSAVRRPRKRRSQGRTGASTEEDERLERIEDIRQNRYERQLRKEYLRKLTTQQFFKSMHMLETNAKNEDSTPFEDYDIFIYRQTAPNFGDRIKELERKLLNPDREARIQEEIRKEGGIGPDENMTDKIKMIEDKLKGRGPTEKKPKDLNRAIGKIEKSDWNVKEIEKKIQENKMGRGKRQERGEKVPKWSREQFDDKFQAMKAKLQRKSMDKDKEREKDKYAVIDETLKLIDRKNKEGNILDMGQRGSNKVSALAEQLAYKTQEPEKPTIAKSSSKAALVLPSQGGSEACHFCKKRVYLMERLSAEGKFFHRGCFRCEYCSTTLRLGNYAFDRDGKHGSRFFCTQHFGQLTQLGPQMSRARGKTDEKPAPVVDVKPDATDATELRKSSESLGPASDEDDAHSEMDEDEWTDRNFGASAAEGSSDSVNSDLSDSEEEHNEVFEEALEPPLNATETLRLAETWTRRYSGARNGEEGVKEEEDESESYEDGSDESCEMGSDSDTDDEESDTATEGEDEIRARELRKLEVPPERPKPHGNSDTGTDTEVGSDEYTTESESEEENSATEISTDSEFDHDGTTPTQHEIPSILIDDVNTTNRKQRIYEEPKKIQARTCHIIRTVNGTVGKPTPQQRTGVKLDLKPLRGENEPGKSSSLKPGINNINNNNTKLTTVVVPTPLINPRAGDYLLNRTHSTEGIASKLSLELKKRYLLGPSGLAGSVKKSGSASTLDSTIKSVVDVISEQQKLLRPAVEPSPTMQAFLQGNSKPRSFNGLANPSPSLPPIFSPSASQQPSFTSLARKDLASMELPFEHVCGLRDKDEPVRANTASEVALDTHRSNAAAPSKVESPLCTSLANGMGSYKPTKDVNAEEEADCRPRSPVHETSIVVPDISWTKKPQDNDPDDMESDSLSSEDSGDSIEDEEDHRSRSPSPVAVSRTPPRVEIHNSSGELMDEGVVEAHEDSHKSDTAVVKTSAPLAPSSGEPLAKRPTSLVAPDRPCAIAPSEKSSPSSPPSTRGEGSESLNNEATLALTETEWSDWAQDSDVGVSEDLEDIEFNINPQYITLRKHQKPKSRRGHSTPARMARCEDFNDLDEFPQHVCGRKDKEQKLSLEETSSNATSRLLSTMDNIEFMDTGEEDDSGTDDLLATTNKTLLKNSGYVQFVNSDDEDLETPIVETPKLPHLATPHVVFFSECGETSDGPDPGGLEAASKNLAVLQPDDEESSLQPEVTSTEETTTSEPTTIKDSPLEPMTTNMKETFYSPKHEEKPDCKTPQDEDIADPSGNSYEDYVRRLQGRISPFSNVRDSIDIRKSRRPVSSVHPQELIFEEDTEAVDITTLPPISGASSTGISRKLEEISREKSKQKNLVHEMVLGKIQRKSQERKNKRSITSSPISPSVPPPILPIDSKASPKCEPISVENTPPSLNTTEPKSLPSPTMDRGSERCHSHHQDNEVPLSDASTSLNNTREEYFTPMTSFKKHPQENVRQRPLSVHSSFRGQRPAKYVGKPAQLPDTPLTNPEAFSCPDIRKALIKTPDDPFKTPVAPPRSRLFDTNTVDREQVREEARLRARLKSDEELGLSPEDHIRSLRQKVTKRPGTSRTMSESSEPVHTIEIGPSTHLFLESTTTNPLFIDSDGVSNPTANRPSSGGFEEGATCEHMRSPSSGPSSPASAPACLTPLPRERHKAKDPERRKSGISQAMSKMSDFFHKAKKEASATPSPPKTPDNKATKDRFSRFKFATKAKGKSAYISSDESDEKVTTSKDEMNKVPMRSKSLDDQIDRRRSFTDLTPPPIPPPPVNYLGLGNGTIPRVSEDSLSENEEESRVTAHSTPTHGGESSIDGGASSASKKHSRMSRRVSRQVQLKRLRMAQEVQRQLEEVEVKQRELERRGVIVEKALRGEGTEEDLQGEEEDLFREWFDLVREQSELRRYERELMLRAKELELEDRHARLQQELREKMSIDEATKTAEDVVKEGQILAEMLDIVERKDSLVTLLEEDRQRYQAEDRDLEAQMLAKGLRLTPIRKESHV